MIEDGKTPYEEGVTDVLDEEDLEKIEVEKK